MALRAARLRVVARSATLRWFFGTLAAYAALLVLVGLVTA